MENKIDRAVASAALAATLPAHTCVDRPHLPCDACGTPTQHTPGQWHSKPETSYVPAQIWTDDGRQLAEVYGEDRAIRAANARLMTVAPEMLEQLERNIQQLDAGCRHCWGDEHPADDAECSFCCSRKATEALVLKARGE